MAALREKLNIKDIADSHNSGYDAHINIKTSAVIFIPNEVNNPDLDISEFFGEDLAVITKDTADFISIQVPDSLESFQIMKDFADSIQSEDLKSSLNDILRRKKPFQNFSEHVYNFGQRENWFAFKEKALMKRIEDELDFLTS